MLAAARNIWRQLTSMRVALILLFLLALASLPGALLPQWSLNSAKTARYLLDHPTLGPILDRSAPDAAGGHPAQPVAAAASPSPRGGRHPAGGGRSDSRRAARLAGRAARRAPCGRCLGDRRGGRWQRSG